MFKLVSEMSQNFMFSPSHSPYTQRVLQYQDGDWNVAEGDGQQVQAAPQPQGFRQHAQGYTPHTQTGGYDVGAGGSGMQSDGAGGYIGQAADHLEPIPGPHLGVGEQSVRMLELKNNQEGFCLLVLKSCE